MKDSASDRGHSRRAFSRVAWWAVSAGRSRGFCGKNYASTAEERRKILLVRAEVILGHAWRDGLAPHAPTQLSGPSHLDGPPERRPSAVLGEGSSSAVLPAQTARCPNARRASRDQRRDPRRDPRRSPRPSAKRSASIRRIRSIRVRPCNACSCVPARNPTPRCAIRHAVPTLPRCPGTAHHHHRRAPKFPQMPRPGRCREA